MRLIETDTLSNQNISSALEVGSYTADAARRMSVRLFAAQIAGNGTYYAYMTIQRGGAGSAYEVQPRTNAAVASGVTAIGFVTIPVDLSSGDIMKVYLIGLAGDTTTPDTICEFWEDDSLRPTTAGQHNVDVNSTGTVGVDWGNVDNPTTTVGLTNTTIGIVTLLNGLADGILTAAKIAAAAFTNAKFGAGAIDSTVAPNLDAAISTRAAASTALSNATWTNALASALTTAAATVIAFLDTTISSRGTADPGDAMDLITNAVDSDALATSAVTEIAAGITVDCSEIAVTLGQTPGQVAELIKGDLLTIYTDSKFSARLYVTGGISTDRDDFLLTVKTKHKRDDKAADTEALLQWSEDSGLLYINEKTASDAGMASSDGTMTISNTTVGDVTTGIIDLTLSAQAAALLQKNTDLVWDGKEIHTNSDNSILKIEGTAQIRNAVTRTIT